MQSTNIESKMLSALMSQDTADPTVSIDEQKRYIKRYVDSLSLEDKKALGHIIITNGKPELLKECSEGTVINMDSIPPFIIEQMYNLVIYKMNKYNS